ADSSLGIDQYFVAAHSRFHVRLSGVSAGVAARTRPAAKVDLAHGFRHRSRGASVLDGNRNHQPADSRSLSQKYGLSFSRLVGYIADFAGARDAVLRHAAASTELASAPLECHMSRPPAPRALHWADLDEFSFVTGMRLLFWLCRIAGRWPVRLILY